jgi:hypothetical protein
LIVLVQKAGRASERVKKRVAIEEPRKDGASMEESANYQVKRGAKRARRAKVAPKRNVRARK